MPRPQRLMTLPALVAAFLAASGVFAGEAPVDAAGLQQLLAEGRYAEAEAQARRRLDGVVQRDCGSQVEADVLDALVAALWRGGRAGAADAVELADRAIAIRRCADGANGASLARSLDNAGVLAFVRGEYDRADEYLHAALDTLGPDSAANTGLLANVHAHLGPLSQERGSYVAALGHYERALTLLTDLRGAGDRRVAMIENNLATLLVKLGDYDRANALYGKALTVLEDSLGASHPLIATAKHNLGELNQRLNRDGQALALYEQAMALKVRALGPDHPSLALTLSNVASLHADHGRFSAARDFARRAMDILEAAPGDQQVGLAYALVNLGRAQAALADPAFQATLERAVDVRSRALGPDNPMLVPPLHFLAEAWLRTGNLEAAFDASARAERIGLAHLRLTARSTSERQALRYAAQRLPSLDVALDIAARKDDPALTARAWDLLVRSRSAVLDEMILRHRLARAETAAAVRPAVDAYQAAAERLSNVLLRGSGDGGAVAYGEQIGALRSRLDGAERAVARVSDEFRRGVSRSEVGYGEVRDALPEGATLVAFAHVDAPRDLPEADARYLALVLRGGGVDPRIVNLGEASRIERAVRRWRRQMTPSAAAADPAGYRAPARRLRALVWDPLDIDADRSGLVLVVPAGALHLVNLAALPLVDGRFLAETPVRIQYLSAERELTFQPEQDRGRGLLVMGGADASATLQSMTAAGGNCWNVSAPAAAGLPGTVQEARTIAALWKATREAAEPLTFVGTSATETIFKRRAPDMGLLHLATHALFLANTCVAESTASPLRLSGLVFSRAPGGPDDGVLTAEEVATLDLHRASWVVLSGCDTGVGTIQIDEGILGLRRAFRIAGARTLIMSLWPAEDSAAVEFMTALYERRRRTGGSAAAWMREAYLATLSWTRRIHHNDHPLYWAAFIASGR